MTRTRHGNLHVKVVGRHRPVSLSRPMSSDIVRHRASRHPALSYDVVRSVNTTLGCLLTIMTSWYGLSACRICATHFVEYSEDLNCRDCIVATCLEG